MLFFIAIVSYFQLSPFIDTAKINITYSIVFLVMSASIVLHSIKSIRLDKLLLPLVSVGLMLFSIALRDYQSLIVIFYVAQIIVSSVYFSKKYAFKLALLSCVLFNIQSSMSSMATLPLLLAVLINNATFLLTAHLSTNFLDLYKALEGKVRQQSKEIIDLKSLNNIIVNNIKPAMLLIEKGRVMHANPSASELFGGESKGLSIKELFFSDFQKIEELCVSDQPVSKTIKVRTFSGKGSDNSEGKILNIVSTPIHTDEVKGHVLLVNDKTDVYNLERKLQQSEKLAAVGQLAAGIAHEIRNPLASISGSLQLMKALDDGDDKDKLSRIVLKEIDRLDGLVTEFLEYAKPQKAGEDIIKINDLLNELCELSQNNPQYGAKLNIVKAFTANAQFVGHSNKLKQAFINIMSNGIQAMEGKDIIRLNVSTYDEPGLIIVRIKDYGLGIPEEQLNKIFEPFHTTKVKGTGLGLAITHRIFESHNATVKVASEINVGTEFVIEFPIESFMGSGQKKQLA